MLFVIKATKSICIFVWIISGQLGEGYIRQLPSLIVKLIIHCYINYKYHMPNNLVRKSIVILITIISGYYISEIMQPKRESLMDAANSSIKMMLVCKIDIYIYVLFYIFVDFFLAEWASTNLLFSFFFFSILLSFVNYLFYMFVFFCIHKTKSFP